MPHILQINSLELNNNVKCHTSLDCSSNDNGNTVCAIMWSSDNNCACHLTGTKIAMCIKPSDIPKSISQGGRECPATLVNPAINCIGYSKTICNDIIKCTWNDDLESCCKTEQYLTTPSGEQYLSCMKTDPNLLAIINKYSKEIITENIFNLQTHSDNNGHCNNAANTELVDPQTPSCDKAISRVCKSVYTWSNFVKAVNIYNKYIEQKIFKPDDLITNIKLLCALFANTYIETGGYLACRESLASVGTEECITNGIASCPIYKDCLLYTSPSPRD